ncbi:ethanolamine utilization protein EutH [Suicoccus acidiformans]|uniref:Ethanolamine utilization protein EutH n=1 Tax=Suicoccus acidiformans TaxID=2036206 RepID=A0A347WLY2_9LACT|nr:ethanolamine utilization protein EutH [Suicoccus acidiformans]AXY26089.1 ethanolamine utilization protein EutH [Suicoccus acidiformans]
MSINEIILWIMAVIMILGAVDKIAGGRFGLGDKFDEGIMAMGSLMLSMAGILVLAPKLAEWLSPILVPVFKFFGADPAMFAGSLLANDMGAYFLAQELTADPKIVNFSGLILGATLGATIVFTIPVGLGAIEERDRSYFARGILSGIITVPIGAFVGGVMLGLDIVTTFKNLLPIIILALVIAIGLALAANAVIKIFIVFGRIVEAIATIGLAIGGLELLTGVKFFENQESIGVAFETVGGIAVTLAGAYGLVYLITKFFQKPLLAVGDKLGMNEVAAAGLIASLANNIAMFGTMDRMDNRGKVINTAFAVSASFTIGDHLGFTGGVAPNVIFPMIIAKLVGGITAIMVAMFFLRNEKTTTI